jgi:hypothetical protein
MLIYIQSSRVPLAEKDSKVRDRLVSFRVKQTVAKLETRPLRIS